MQEQYKRYADISAQIKVLENEQELIGEKIFTDLATKEGNQVKEDFGTFFYKTTKKWAYPDYVKTAEVTYKSEKKRAEESGEAKAEETKSLSFRIK